MAWIPLEYSDQMEDNLEEYPEAIQVEAQPPAYDFGINPINSRDGFRTWTIANPAYGSGVDFPLKGAPTYNRGESIANRRYDGIVYP